MFFVYLAAAETRGVEMGYPTSRQVLRFVIFGGKGFIHPPTHCLYEMEDEFCHKELGAQLLLLDVGWRIVIP